MKSTGLTQFINHYSEDDLQPKSFSDTVDRRRSPCLTCDTHLKGKDKLCAKCQCCQKRKEYNDLHR